MAAEHTNYLSPRKNLKMLVVLFILLMTIPLVSYSAAGKVIFSLGTVHVERFNTTEPERLARGDEIDEGDVISTAANGQLQLRMADGGLIAIRPSSKFKIESFTFNNNEKQDKTFFKLLKGSFRSVTGSIGEANKNAYKVNTPIATIGIRGTDYTARLCDGDCNADLYEDGLYIGVMSGGIILTNEAGSLDIDASEYGYIQELTSEPILLESAPGELLFAATTINQSDADLLTKNEGASDSIAISSRQPDQQTNQQGEPDSDLLTTNAGTTKNISTSSNRSAQQINNQGKSASDLLTKNKKSNDSIATSSRQPVQQINNRGESAFIDTPTLDIVALGINPENFINHHKIETVISANTTDSSNTEPTTEQLTDINTSTTEPSNNDSTTATEPEVPATTVYTRNIAVSDYVFSKNNITTLSAVDTHTPSDFSIDENQGLIAFKITTLDSSSTLIEQTASIGTAVNADTGTHIATGISWGRWESGRMQLSDGISTRNIDLSENKLHWLVMSATDDQIALPSTGIANYTVVGNTSPTDNFGNIGILDTTRTSLTADFANQTISANIELSINDPAGDNYSIIAKAADIPINNSNATFSGNMTTINFSAIGAGATATGRVDGAFSPKVDAVTRNPAAAGFTYSVNDSIEDSTLSVNDITVNGAVALELTPEPQ